MTEHNKLRTGFVTLILLTLFLALFASTTETAQATAGIGQSCNALPAASALPDMLNAPIEQTGTRKTATYKDLSFDYDSSLATSFVGKTVPAYIDGFGSFPEHILIQLVGYPIIREYVEPVVRLFPVGKYQLLPDPHGKAAEEEINKLKTLLSQKPSLPSYKTTIGGNAPIIPYLPGRNAGFILSAKTKYSSSSNVNGISYIPYFWQQAHQVDTDNFYYTFQGLSNDGQYYIAAEFPIALSKITLPKVSNQQLDTNIEVAINYVTQVAQALDRASSNSYSPNLDLLDALFKSIRVGPVPTPVPVPQRTTVASVTTAKPVTTAAPTTAAVTTAPPTTIVPVPVPTPTPPPPTAAPPTPRPENPELYIYEANISTTRISKGKPIAQIFLNIVNIGKTKITGSTKDKPNYYLTATLRKEGKEYITYVISANDAKLPALDSLDTYTDQEVANKSWSLDKTISINLYNAFYFFIPVVDAELEITLIPDNGVNVGQTKYIFKPVTVKPDFTTCAFSTILVFTKLSWNLAAVAPIPQLAAARPVLLAYAPHVNFLIDQVIECKEDSNCQAQAANKQLEQLSVEKAAGLAGEAAEKRVNYIGTLRDSLGQAKDLLTNYQVTLDEACVNTDRWIQIANRNFSKTNTNQKGIYIVDIASPAYPLGVDETGKRVGFLPDGQIIEEITGAKAIQTGEKRSIVIPSSTPIKFSITGYASGKMDVYITLPQPQGSTIYSYYNLPVTKGLQASLISTPTIKPMLAVSQGGVTSLRLYAPNQIEKVGDPLLPRTGFAQTSQQNDNDWPWFVATLYIILSVLFLTFVFWHKRHRKSS